MSTYILIVQLC